MKEDDVDGSRLPRTLFVSTKKKNVYCTTVWLTAEQRKANQQQRKTGNKQREQKKASLIRIDLFRGVIEVTVWMVENP